MLELNAGGSTLLLGSDTPTIDVGIDETPRNESCVDDARASGSDARIRSALQHLPYGIYVVGTVTPEGKANAMVADWVMQVSFKPRIVCISFERDAASLRNLRETRATDRQSAAGVGHGPGGAIPAAERPVQNRGPFGEVRGAGQDARRPDTCNWIIPSWETARPCWRTRWPGSRPKRSSSSRVGEHILALCRVFDGDALPIDEGPLTSLYTGWHYGG